MPQPPLARARDCARSRLRDGPHDLCQDRLGTEALEVVVERLVRPREPVRGITESLETGPLRLEVALQQTQLGERAGHHDLTLGGLLGAAAVERLVETILESR